MTSAAGKALPSLDKGPLSLRELRDGDRLALLDLLDTIRGRKALVLEADFAAPLSLLVEASTLREHGVELFGVLGDGSALASQLEDREIRQVVYLLHTRLESVHAAVAHVAQCRRLCSSPLEFAWLVIPRVVSLAPRMLERAGLLADVTLLPTPLSWIPLDEDLISLELPDVFREWTADGDPSSLHELASALSSLQQRFGAVARIKAKGTAAVEVAGLLGRMRREQGSEGPAVGQSGIDGMILMDRSVDIVSPACTQLTYEGLLEETMGIRCGQVVLESEGGRKVHGLNSSDAVFVETRDKFYMDARRWINETLRTIQQFRDQGIHSADISALRGFVSELRDKFVRIPLHTSLIEQLAASLASPGFAARQKVEAGLLDGGDELPAILDLMYTGEGAAAVLRLLCLYCAVHGGIPRKAYDGLRRDFLNTYGHEHLLTLAALQRAGLVDRRESRRSAFPLVREAFGLLAQEEGAGADATPDIHFTYAGYAPLSVRVVQAALSGSGWGGVEAALGALPGPTAELAQGVGPEGQPTTRTDRGPLLGGGGAAPAGVDLGTGARRPLVLVVYVGGVTAAEVAALRWLAAQRRVPCDFLVATTGVVSGRSLVQEFMPPGG
uniref:Vacuolar protein sorting-associated protein 33-like protein n=1 Tax=Auxenochlorella protothecoides TaxID=3075 RepID=A0A1D2A473_AUXPR